ncbi:olfactory receptor 11A1-like [Perca fluviatilis]|uniref:olfactory receptor 11A1-like n=1 Tax=Perca fluviatilis TaxID=8168 RepID=UPI001963F91D|nr:olfactory receptor 11A1-like [Perca fluviatilis]
MINSSNVSYFTLAAYFDIELFTFLYFFLILSLYVFIVCANLLLIVVICMNRSLHEPMYLFLCSLFVNELYGSTGLFPFLLVQILSDIHTVSAPFCFLQMFCVYTYGSVEFINLALMSYDRYLAICYPLQYHVHMTSNKVVVLIAVTWSLPFFAVFVTTLLSASLQLCGNIINSVYCDNYSIIKLACYETRVNNVYELVAASLTVCVPVSIIFYTYMKIFKVCFSGSKQTRQKAVSTCTPHLASLLNFSFGVSFEILQSRFDMSSVPMMLRILLSLYFLTCQPIFNPVIYGLNMSKIRIMCQSLFSISVLGDVKSKVQQKQLKQKQTHDANRKVRSFSPGDNVFVRNYSYGPKWIPAVIQSSSGPVSYTVIIGCGQPMKRHMDQVRARLADTVPSSESEDEEETLSDMVGGCVGPLPTSLNDRGEPPPIEPQDLQLAPDTRVPPDLPIASVVRRSERERRSPGHLKDFVRQSMPEKICQQGPPPVHPHYPFGLTVQNFFPMPLTQLTPEGVTPSEPSYIGV